MKYFIAFVAGGALGSLATWMFVKKKYEQIAQEEIDSVKEVYSKRKPKTEKNDDDEEEAIQVDEKEVAEYEKIIETTGYSKYSDIFNNAKTEAEHDYLERPYVIRPEEFGELDGYEMISLTHYSDGILADDDQRMADDEIDEVVGADYAEHFGEYEDDSVFVRNDRLKCDYEILFDHRKYSELRNVTYHGGFPS